MADGWQLPTKPWPSRPTADGWQLPQKPSGALAGDLLTAADVPVYQKQPFILKGYRRMPQGPCGLFWTMFTLHNETGNMWTHLLGFGYFAAIAAQLCIRIASPEERETVTEAAWVLVLVVATAFCLLCSFSYHLCSCTERCVRECTYRMDLSGIVVLIATSYFTGIALGYRCFPGLRNFYLLYSACVVVALAVPLLRPKISLEYDLTRHFIICAALGLVPAGHFVCISSPEDIAVVLPHLGCMFACYGIGAWFFVMRWPERRWPGKFDLLGHSHQVWHIFVLLAALSWIRGCFAMLENFGGAACASGETSTPEPPSS